ncbi:glycosyltransferase family 39 protein [bacterium]|nr:glycosyltransferase family 39 protein [bacterium]
MQISIKISEFAWSVRLFLLAVVILTIFILNKPILGPDNYDSWDYAQLGQNIASGQFWFTRAVTPLQLRFTPEIPAPDLWRAPLYPLLLGISTFLFGRNVFSLMLPGLLSFLLLPPIVYLLARRFFSHCWALAAGVLMAINPNLLKYSALIQTEGLATLLLLVAVIGLDSRKHWLLIGLLTGLAGLARFNFILLLPIGWLVCLAEETDQRRKVALFSLGWFLIWLPWMFRNISIGVSPLFHLSSIEWIMHSSIYPGYNLYRMISIEPPSTVSFFLQNPGILFNKIKWGSERIVILLPGLVRDLLVVWPLVFLGALSGFQRKGWGRLNAIIMLALAFQVIPLIVFKGDPRILVPFIPFMLIWAVGGMMTLWDIWAWKRSHKIVITLILCILALRGFTSSAMDIEKVKGITSIEQDLAKVTDVLLSEGAIISDVPWAVSYYTQRNAVWLPLNVEELMEVMQKVDVAGIYISNQGDLGSVKLDDNFIKDEFFQESFHVVDSFGDEKSLWIRIRAFEELQ